MNKEPNTTYLCYLGKVDLKVKVKGKTIIISTFNAGELYLKYIFAKMLVGDLAAESINIDTSGKITYNKRFVPSALEIYKLESGQDEKSFTTQAIPVSGELVDLLNGFYTGVCFTAYVPFDKLQEEVDPVKEAASGSKFYLYLMSGEDSTYKLGEEYHKIAKIGVTAEALSYITPGTVATVTWTMKLINTEDVK